LDNITGSLALSISAAFASLGGSYTFSRSDHPTSILRAEKSERQLPTVLKSARLAEMAQNSFANKRLSKELNKVSKGRADRQAGRRETVGALHYLSPLPTCLGIITIRRGRFG